MNSASNQKFSKLELSESFDSEVSELEENIQIKSVLEKVYFTLIKSKVIPKESKHPECSLNNLEYFVNVLCDELLLEIDLPTSRTHCSVDETSHKQNEFSLLEEDDDSDILTKLFQSSKPFVVNNQNRLIILKVLRDLSDNTETEELKKKVSTLQEKLSLYGEAFMKMKIRDQEKTREIENLRRELQTLKYEKSKHKE